jgi:hypothetical protein
MAPPPWVRICTNSCFMQAHTPAQVDRVDTVEDLCRFVGGIARRNLNAGVVERHVEPAERVDGRLHHGSHAVLVGHVATNAQDLVAGGGQSSAAELSVVSLMSARTTAAPASANARAVARPMPELDPDPRVPRRRSPR